MSRKQRVLKKRYAIFCEGDAEYNYTDKMRKKQGVELVLKPINTHGGGYSNFLCQIKKKTFDISIKSTIFDQDMLGQRTSNIEEFFDVIDW